MLSNLLAHNSIATTDRYIRSGPTELDEEIEELKDAILSVNFPKKEILDIKEIFPDIRYNQ